MGLRNRLRTSFVTGLILVMPLAVTAFVLQFVFKRVTGALNPVVKATGLADYTANIEIVAQLLAVVLLAIGITLLGYVASRSVGQRLFGGLERAVRLVPFVRTVYFGVRQVSESLVERSAGYESVVLVEYPRDGIYSIAFVTNTSPQAAQGATAEKLHNVFVPHSPNPTAGSLILAPESDIHEIDMPVRKGLRLLVTTGLSADDVEEFPDGVVD